MSIVKSQHGKGVEICVSWVDASNGFLPPHAIEAGDSCFVIRAKHNNEYTPGKFVVGHHSVYISHGGKEISKSHYQVLVDTSVLSNEGLEWKYASGETIPNGAIVGGTDNGSPLYIARSEVSDETSVGKFFPEHSCAYVPHGGEEHKREEFEVLCCVAKHL